VDGKLSYSWLHAVAEAELQRVKQLQCKDSEISVLRSQLDEAQRQQRLQFTQIQMEVSNNRFVHCVFCYLPHMAHYMQAKYMLHVTFTSPPILGVKYCDEYVCLYVCLCFSVHLHISQTTWLNFTKFLLLLPVTWLSPSLVV